MKILVTGANGFLGSTVVELAKNAGHEVYATARTSENNRIVADLSSPVQIEHLLDSVVVPQAIINCASMVDFNDLSLNIQYSVNSLAPSLMAAWCVSNNSYLCQASSVSIHGTNLNVINSSSPTLLNTDYGKSKWLAEQMIEASGAIASYIRFGGIYGNNGSKHLSLNQVIRSAIKGIAPTIVGQGFARRNYIHVRDAANVLLYCVEKSLTGIRWSAGSESITIAEMMKAVCDVYMPDIKPVFSSGQEANNQIVESSEDIPKGLGFKDALEAYK